MRAQHIPAGSGGSGHTFRDLCLGVLFIVGVLAVAPSLGAPSHNTEQSAASPLASSNQTLIWTVTRQKGFNPDWNCWMLQLHREYKDGETDGDFCAKDKNDYDSHPLGASYQTQGDWLDNIVKDAPNATPSDHA